MGEAFPVPAALGGLRVDRAVALLTGWSRAEVQALVEAGAVLVDGRPVRGRLRRAGGDAGAARRPAGVLGPGVGAPRGPPGRHRRADRTVRAPADAHGGAGFRPAGADALRGPAGARGAGGHAPRLPSRDRAHAPDPRAPPGHP